MVSTFNDIRIFRKQLDFKYNSEELARYIFSPLRLMKNKKQLSKKFKFIDVFPTDDIKTFHHHFLKVNELQYYEEKKEIIIILNHYLNALKIYNFCEEYIEKNIDKPINMLKHSLLETCFTKNKKDIYKLSFFKIYRYVITNQLTSLFTQSDIQNCELYHKKSDIFITGILNHLKFNVSKNNILPCSITGLFHRKNDVLQIYNNRIIFNEILFNNHIFFNDYKIISNSYAHKFFVKGYGERKIYFIDYDEDDQNNEFNFVYVKELNYCVASYDIKTLNKYPQINIDSMHNRLRYHDFRVHKELPKQMLPHEKKNEKDNLYFGLEIEVGYTNRCPHQKIHKLIEEEFLQGLAICKSDGSIDNGFEINLVPMTFDYIKNTDLYFKFFDKVKDYLRSYKMPNTGIHIHVSKKPLTILDQGKILEFINSIRNREYIVKLSQRDPNTFCQVNDTLKVKDILKKDRNPKYYDRDNQNHRDIRVTLNDKYQAVNILNDETIEIRIFKGNIVPQTISRFIEFTHCLIQFVKNNSSDKMFFRYFMEYAKKEKIHYPFLNEFHNQFNSEKNVKELKENFRYSNKFKKSLRNIAYNIPQLNIFTGKPKVKKNRKIINR